MNSLSLRLCGLPKDLWLASCVAEAALKHGLMGPCYHGIYILLHLGAGGCLMPCFGYNILPEGGPSVGPYFLILQSINNPKYKENVL